MTKQVRWKCEHCESGVLAPTKPRRNDVRRYCLPCSQRTGKLVERFAPSLQTQRTKRQAIVAKKTDRKREQIKNEKQQQRAAQRCDAQRRQIIHAEAKRIWKYMEEYHNGKPLPRINIAKGRGSQMGHATYWANSIQINVDAVQDKYSSKRVWQVLAHELAHCAQPPVTKPGSKNHDSHHRKFYYCLRDAFQKRWKCEISFHEVSTWGYSVDHIIMKQAQQHINWELPNQTTKEG